MPSLPDAKVQVACTMVEALAIALLNAHAPYDTVLIAIPVLYVAVAPVHAWLARLRGPNVAANVIVGLALLVLVVLGGACAGLIVTEAGRIAGSVTHSPLLARLSELGPGGVDLGARLGDLGATLVSWIGSSALGLIGSASRFALNLPISLFVLFYPLLRPRQISGAVP